MSPLRTVRFMDCDLHAATQAETVEYIRSRIAERRFTQHVVVNVAKLIHMRNDLRLRESVSSCDVINIDGMGVVMGARLMGHDVPERVAGVDLFHALLDMSSGEGYPVFLLGATGDVVDKTAKELEARHPGLLIAGYHHGYFWDDEPGMVQEIRSSGARLLFVAVTSPKKENFINRWRDQLGVDFVMGVGGTFDVVAGKVSRAPAWMQRNGLEWLHRTLQEPRRLWKRYLITNTVFVGILVKEMFRQVMASLGRHTS